MLQYSCLENPLSDREVWQATVYRVTKSWTWPKWPCAYRCKTFLPVAALSQGELSTKVVQLLGLQVPWQTQVCRHTDCLHRRSYGPIRVFFPSSFSWRSEGLFGQSFSVAQPVQALRGLPCLGFFFVVPHVRHIEGPPHSTAPPIPAGVLFCSSMYQAFDGPASLWWHVGREAMVMALLVSPCFHGCLAFLLQHFPLWSPLSHPLDQSLCS